MQLIQSWFHLDALALTMMTLVGFVGLSVGLFGYRYMHGDRLRSVFFMQLSALIASVFVMVSADHLLLILLSWVASNFLLARLMLHKKSWRAAVESSRLAWKHFVFGMAAAAAAFGILYWVTGEFSWQAIGLQLIDSPWLSLSAFLLLMAAMVQSAVWPFHRWLLSSLNSPTPVSAIMHAGLVNGGGFILVRFSELYLALSQLLVLMFVFGIVSALLGTLWKLMQSDVKRTLACSTMSQMGFMVAQCGLGLFPAAIAHLFWHGLFKAYLFMSSATLEKNIEPNTRPSLRVFFKALVCGLVSAWVFAWITNKPVFAGDTTLFLVVLVMVTAAQCALSLLSRLNVGLSFVITLVLSSFYAGSILVIESALSSAILPKAQALNIIHIAALLVLILAWLCLLFWRSSKSQPKWQLKAYVNMLNASQPEVKTITAHRNHYQY